jgi:HlyD family secretion protein
MLAALLLGSCSREGSGITGSGTIEMDEVDVASLVGGRIVRLHVDEGDSVQAGDTLAVLDRGELEAEVEASRAQTSRAEAEVQDLRAGARAPEIRAARAEVEAATAQARLTESELERMKKLAAQDLASPAELDRAQSARDAAAARSEAAAAQLRLLESGARRQQIAAAEQAVQAARAQASASQRRAAELVLTAPISGTVLLRNLETGELAMPGTPVLTLGKPDSLWMRVYIAAPKLTRVRIGAPAEVRVIGARRVFNGRVVEIADRAEFTPRAALTEEEQANLVFGVKIVLDPTGGALKAGLPADARILVPASPVAKR